MTPEEIVARAINPDAWWNHDNGLITTDEAGKLDIVEPSMRRARAALRALEEAGYRVVPVEPTEAMIRATGWEADEPHGWQMAADWRAMLDAAGLEKCAEGVE